MFYQDFSEFIKSLNKNEVLYLIVGGYAVAFHRHPRYTKDIDIWIESTNGKRPSLVEGTSIYHQVL